MENWNAPNVVPDVPKGDYEILIVAVRRKRAQRVFSFGACYLNGFRLNFVSGCGDCEDEGVCPNWTGDGCPRTGWYLDEPADDDVRIYTPLLEKGDELLGWQTYPVFHVPEPSP